jgi:hypothetical protein
MMRHELESFTTPQLYAAVLEMSFQVRTQGDVRNDVDADAREEISGDGCEILTGL